MTKQDMVQTVFTKLTETLGSHGFMLAEDKNKDGEVTQTAEEKLESVAKLLGLVKGVRKVGGVAATDLGLLFIGVDPAELEKARKHAEMQAEIAKLQAEIDERKAALEAA